MSKETNNSSDGFIPQRTSQTKNNKPKWHAWAWAAMLFVLASIAFSSYMVYFGSDNLAAKLAILPQVVFAGAVAFYKFVIAK